ncbi:TIGR04168 family protein [Leptolyngbya sp. NK1-12]|uniref:TIGR04168 family protein n=1 Tax=Leptolyngbya sp. NK1-12 TaxID=2547451 RepID=A0AA96WFD8_9CYAN|nr:TIGR04168 family protein [Leptolyngbya sp. NK1-12]WNZ24178.1 TIGR04168 family protein [Leptolyngbya sp. NK1-12]
MTFDNSQAQVSPAQISPTSTPTSEPASCTIAVVGDVHDLWDSGDETALQHLGVDLVLLVGDFGNEAVDVVRTVAQLSLPKAVILGNHDAWFTATAWGRKLRGLDPIDRVQQQLDLLGDTHIGFGKLDFPQFGLTVVGSRPFSWGGSTWKNRSFYQQRFGVDGFEASTAKIVAAAAGALHQTIIFIGHCGPKGLGEQAEDPCGKDWNPIGGDYGDPDFTAAIEQTRALGKQISLVAFGHMHHSLRHTKTRQRKMLDVDSNGTVYLNAASVPRIRSTPTGQVRNFSLVTLTAGVVTKAALVWIHDDLTIQSEQILYQLAGPVLASEETKLLR